MPATRVTIAINSNQSIRAPLLIPEKVALNPRDVIFKAAKAKLRLKRPVRIFLGGAGDELAYEADWKLHLRNDATLVISQGEEYIGLMRDAEEDCDDVDPECPVVILAEKAYVDETSIKQLETTARTLPGIIHAVGQPDLHPGSKFPIGAVFVSHYWIHPPLIGGDIGCGMAWYKTTLTRDQVDGDKGRKIAEKLRGLEGEWRTQRERQEWLQDRAAGWSYATGRVTDKALGTIGAGNHFAELQVVEELSVSALGVQQNDVILLVHSGSRGYGAQVLKESTAGSHISLEECSEEADRYLRDHDNACQWAKANRDLIAVRFLACLEPSEPVWDLGRNSGKIMDLVKDVSATKAKLAERRVVDIWHNNVERVEWPPQPPSTPASASASTLSEKLGALSIDEQSEPDYVYIHRKGAAPTYNPSTKAPLTLLPLPGSRGTPTLIIKPIFSEATGWGQLNALSLAHGAGRSMSRAKALTSLGQKYKNQNLLEPSKSGEGTWVICDEKDLVYEEAPDAYKDIHAVAEDLVREGAAQIVGWCKARQRSGQLIHHSQSSIIMNWNSTRAYVVRHVDDFGVGWCPSACSATCCWRREGRLSLSDPPAPAHYFDFCCWLILDRASSGHNSNDMFRNSGGTLALR
ncbi:hypothetical protein CC80DRAFT_537559 [Byssothecium circinans]|uniref:3'-phosphate/5'-hydroxy nucleic acid ligase n=1 Tax=Byssothecium circinans TaxID=147558 RepID=A0A6A5TNR1_9PLEO|nr:hypothetical protein CC80DRAFT_537559 [Byssothecium circinans]